MADEWARFFSDAGAVDAEQPPAADDPWAKYFPGDGGQAAVAAPLAAPLDVPPEPEAVGDPKLLANLQEIDRQRWMDPAAAKSLKGYERFKYFQGLVPFLGDAVDSAEKIQGLGALGRIKDGTATDEDYAIAATVIDRQRQEQEAAANQSTLGKAADIFAHLPKYIGEFALTGGGFGVGKQIAGKGLQALGKATIGKAATQALAKTGAAQLPIAAAEGLVGVAGQTLLNPAAVAANTAERALPAVDENGKVGDLDGFVSSLPAGFLDTFIEIGSERSGAAIAKLPGVKQVAEGLASTVVAKWLANAPGRTPQMLNELVKAGGWNGIVGEVLEERVGDAARLATGLESTDQNVVGQLVTGQWGKAGEQLQAELLGIGAGAGFGAAVGKAASVADGRPPLPPSIEGQPTDQRQGAPPREKQQPAEAQPVQTAPPAEPPKRDARWKYTNGKTLSPDPRLADTTALNFPDSTPRASDDPANALTLEAFPPAQQPLSPEQAAYQEELRSLQTYLGKEVTGEEVQEEKAQGGREGVLATPIEQPAAGEAESTPPAPVTPPKKKMLSGKPATPPAQTTYQQKPGDNFPDQAHGWLVDAISRRPDERQTPEQVAEWIRGGFPEGNWRSYAEQQGHKSLEESVTAVMGEMATPAPATPPKKKLAPTKPPATTAVVPPASPVVPPPKSGPKKKLAPAPRQESNWRPIGPSSTGQELFEDENGVRSVVEDGIRITESVAIVPGRGISIDRSGSARYKTKAEVEAEAAPAPVGSVIESPDLQLDRKREEQRAKDEAVAKEFTPGQRIMFTPRGVEATYEGMGSSGKVAVRFDDGSVISGTDPQNMAPVSDKAAPSVTDLDALANQIWDEETAPPQKKKLAPRQERPSTEEESIVGKPVGPHVNRRFKVYQYGDRYEVESLALPKPLRFDTEQEALAESNRLEEESLSTTSWAQWDKEKMNLGSFAGESEESTKPSRPAKKPLLSKNPEAKQDKPKTNIQEKAGAARESGAAARKAFIDAVRDSVRNPKVTMGGNADLMRLAVKAAIGTANEGIWTFAEYVETIYNEAPDLIDTLAPYLEAAWRVAKQRDTTGKVSESGRVADVLPGIREKGGSDGNESSTDDTRRPGEREPGAAGATTEGGEAAGPSERGGDEVSAEDGGDAAESPVSGPDGGKGTAGGGASSAKPGKEEQGDEPRRKRLAAAVSNHRIGSESLTPGGPGAIVARTSANIEAIRLLKDLEQSGRPATPEQKRKMALYVGWGGLSQVFDRGKGESMLRGGDSYYRDAGWEKTWGKFYRELKGDKAGEYTGLLTEEEWSDAAKSTEFAHYTSRDVIERMWDAAARLGFTGGKVLEPAAGVGHFFGLMPESQSELVGVELDSISGRLTKQLYPEATVFVQGLEDTKIPPNSIDLAISNVPFSATGPSDGKKRYGKQLNLHNYFLARMIDAVKPGGLVVAISTHNTLDSQQAQRALLGEKAALVGAIRLPNNAFKANANTDVVTDIIFLRKHDGTNYRGEAWNDLAVVGTDKVPELDKKGKATGKYVDAPIAVNEYFKNHPEMVLGLHSLQGKMRREGEYTLLPKAGEFSDQLAKAIAGLPENVMGQGAAEEADFEGMDKAGDIPNSTLMFKDGRLVLTQDGKFVSAGELHPSLSAPSAQTTKQVKAYIALRDHYSDHLKLMASPEATDTQIAVSQKELNKLYDAAISALNGALGGQAAKKFQDEAGYYRLLGLEKPTVERDPKTGKDKTRYDKADVFTKRTVNAYTEPTSAGSLKEAVQLAIAFRGSLDLGHVASLIDSTPEKVADELREGGLAFPDPKTGMWTPAFLYLSGNVRTKLEQAKTAAADDKSYQANVDALEKVQPEPVSGSSISFRLAGAHWIPDTILSRFGKNTFHDNSLTIRYVPETDTFYVGGKEDSVGAEEFGTNKMRGLEILRAVLNMREIRIMGPRLDENGRIVYLPSGKPSMTVDQEATIAAQGQAERIAAAFQEWAKGQEDVMLEIQRAFNEKYNFWVRTEYDPELLATPGANPTINLRPYQKAAIVRLLMEGHGMLAHGVGSGKTMEAITWAIEGKRLGLHKKPMIAVHNITLSQYAEAIERLYPGKNVYVAKKSDMTGNNRKKFLARIAANDYDLIILPHSSFNLIPNDPAHEEAYVRELLDELETAIRDVKAAEGKNSPSVKDLEKAKRALQDRLVSLQKRMKERSGNDLFFEQMGIDALLVDEAHEFKKPPFVTKLGRLRGLDRQTSQRAASLAMKMRSVRNAPGNKGIRGTALATGTPVTNTLAEAWHMIRLASPHMLKEFKADTFDRFVGTFASVDNVLEQNAGGTWKYYPTLAKFRNGFQLGQLLNSSWDVLTSEELVEYFKSQGEAFPEVEGGSPEAVSVPMTPQVKVFSDWLKDVFHAWSKLTGNEKKMFSWVPVQVYLAGKAAAMDMRMVRADAKDEQGSKVNEAVRRALEIYKNSKSDLGAQAIFADTMNRVDLSMLAAFANGEDVSLDFTESDEEEAERDEADPSEGIVSSETAMLYNDIKRKLIKEGVPEGQIAIISDYRKEADRKGLFEKLNSGEVRIVVGGTKTLGTGANIQRRLAAIHHLDIPWTAADYVQRNGRGIRFGNLNKSVKVMTYGMEGTTDASIFGKILRKAAQMDQAMQGKLGAEFDDPFSDVTATAEEMMAAFAGDTRIFEQKAAEADARTLKIEKETHDNRIARARERLDSSRRSLAEHKDHQETFEKIAPTLEEIDPKNITATVNGEPFTGDRKALLDAMDKALKDGEDRILADTKKGKLEKVKYRYGFDASNAAVTVKVGPATMRLMVGYDSELVKAEGGKGLVAEWTPTKGVFVQTTLDNGKHIGLYGGQGETVIGGLDALADAKKYAESMAEWHRSQQPAKERDIEELQKIIKQEFPKEKEEKLATALATSSRLKAELEAAGRAEDEERDRKRQGKGSEKKSLKDRAAQARKEAQDAADDLGDYLDGRVYSGVDPELVRRVGVLVAKSIKAGTLTFADFLADVAKMLGEAQAKILRPTLASEWNKAADGNDKLDRADEPAAPESTAPAPPAAEPEADDGDSPLTSIKNEVVNELRAKRGVAELPEVPPQSLEEWIGAATARIQNDPSWPSRLVEELVTSPRNLSNVEAAGMQLYYRRLHNEFEAASDRLFGSQDDPAAKAQAQTEADVLSDQLLRTEAATKAAGREWGRAGVARQIMLAQDYSLAALTRRARVAIGGARLTEEQQAEVKKLADRVVELEAELAKQIEARQQAEQERVIDQQIEEDKEAVKPPRLRKPSARKAAVLKRIEDAWTEFSSMLASTAFSTPVHLAVPAAKIIKGYVELGIVSFSEFMAHAKQKLGKKADAMRPTFQQAWDDLKASGDIPDITADEDDVRAISRLAREIQRSLVEAGIVEREAVVDGVHEALREFLPEISRRQTMDALSGYGQFSPLSKDATDAIIRDINGQLQQLAKLEDMQKGQAPKKTGQERRTPTDEERRLIQQVNEAKKRGGFNVTDPESQLRSSLDAAKRATRNRIADLTHEIKTQERIVAKRNELKPDEELTKLRAYRDELLEEHRKLFPKPGATREQKLAAAGKAIDRAIAQLEADLQTGQVGPKPKPQALQSPELDAKRARLNALRAQRDELRAQNPEWSLKAYKRSLEKRIADYQARAAAGDFAKKERKTLAPDQKTTELRRQLQETKKAFNEKADAWRRSKLPPLQKAIDLTKETLLASRAILTSLDLSAVFRQGGFASFSHPAIAAKAIPRSLKAGFSKAGAFAEAEDIRSRPNAQLYETAKLAIAETDGPLNRQEETYAGRWSRRIPGVAASERAYVAFLNRLRADVFDAMLASLGRNSPASLDEAKVIADFVNTATGRGNLGRFNAAAGTLSTVFFAPRFVASRFQLLARPATLPFESSSSRVKGAIAKEYGRYLVGLGLMYALAYMLLDDDDDEAPLVQLDPRSSDFGKIRLGETRIDPLSGLSQSIVLLSQLASGQRKGATGEVKDIRGPDVKFGQPTSTGVMGRFVRSKLSPVFGSAVDIVSGEDFIGQPVTPGSVITDAVVPLSFRDVLDNMREQGVPAGTALALVSLLGMSVSTYGPKTTFANKTPEEQSAQRTKEAEQRRKDLKRVASGSPVRRIGEPLAKYQERQANYEALKRRSGVSSN